MYTIYSSKLILEQLGAVKDLAAATFITCDDTGIHTILCDGSEYVIDRTVTSCSCSCSFSKTRLLPCKHIFCVRQQNNVQPVFEEQLVSNRWLKQYQIDNSVGYPNVMDASIDHQNVVEIPQKISKKRKILNRCEKYNKSLKFCREICSIVSDYRQDQFDSYMESLSTFHKFVFGGKNIVVMDTSNHCDDRPVDTRSADDTSPCDNRPVDTPSADDFSPCDDRPVVTQCSDDFSHCDDQPIDPQSSNNSLHCDD